MRSEAVLERVKRYARENDLKELSNNIKYWEDAKEWKLNIGRKVELYGYGIGKIVDAPNYAVYFFEINDKWYNVAQTEEGKTWKFLDKII